ncbi:hypothetical protein [Desulforhopalus sp. 52FAK]
MLPDDKVTISVIVDREVKEQLEKYAKELDLSVSRLSRNLIYMALDDLKVLKKTGLVRLVMGFRAISAELKEKFSSKL